MGNVATRLLSLILFLQSHATWKAADLAGELGVSERTVHRYMRMLEELGIPLGADHPHAPRVHYGTVLRAPDLPELRSRGNLPRH